MQATVPPDDHYGELTLDQLRALSNADFDAFLVRVFELAGYQVHLSGTTLSLGLADRLVAYASVNRGNKSRVGAGPVKDLQEACASRRSQIGTDIFGIVITRTDFMDEVVPTDYHDPLVVLLNGDRLLRYYRFLLDYRMEGYRFPALSPTLMTSVDSIRDIYAGPPHVLVITNNRGGIGKSTTALNIAYGLAEKGKSVLAIDMDPQANFTEMLGGHLAQLQQAHIGRHFVGSAALPNLVQMTPFTGIKLVAAHPDMSKALIHPERWLRSHFEFAQLLRTHDIVHHPLAGAHGFEWIVIDTPPDMGFYTQAAITAANYLLAPTFPSQTGNIGIEILIKTAQVRSNLTGMPKHAKFLGFVATRYSDGRATAALKDDFRNLENRINTFVGKAAFADSTRPTFLPSIPETPKIINMTRDLIKATQNGQSFRIFEKEGTGRNEAGAAYKQLVEEVLNRAGIS